MDTLGKTLKGISQHTVSVQCALLQMWGDREICTVVLGWESPHRMSSLCCRMHSSLQNYVLSRKVHTNSFWLQSSTYSSFKCFHILLTYSPFSILHVTPTRFACQRFYQYLQWQNIVASPLISPFSWQWELDMMPLTQLAVVSLIWHGKRQLLSALSCGHFTGVWWFSSEGWVVI